MLAATPIQTPCQLRPAAFLQPGEDDRWASLPAARWAVQQCRNVCPKLTKCALEALALGNLSEEGRAQHPAAGVIMAGVVCNGSLTTRAMLMAVVDRRALPHTPVRTELCAGVCGNRLVTDGHRPLNPGEALVFNGRRRMCRACYYAAYRARTLPVAEQRPTHCCVCYRPMTTKTRKLAGHVVHESGGRCGACARAVARERARGAQAVA